MKFAFAPWEFGGDTRAAALMARFLQAQAEEPRISRMLATLPSPHASINFLVVDVTPSSNLPVELERALASMLLPSEPWSDDCARPIARFLFVGASSALDGWEIEANAVSVKKSVEFYIRTLQSAGIAHYGTGGADVANLSASLATSALLGLMRHYEGRALPSLADEVAQLKREIDTVFEHTRKYHLHLVDLQPDLPAETRNMDLLLSLNAVTQFGKRQPEAAYAHARFMQFTPDRSVRTRKMDDDIPQSTEPERPSGYGIWADLDERLAEWGSEGTPPDAAKTVPIADLSLGLQRYNIMRDLARCIGTGAVPALTEAGKGIEEWGVLLVDDRLYDAVANGLAGGLREDLLRMFHLIGWQNACFVAKSDTFKTSDSRDLIRDDEVLQKGIDVLPLSPRKSRPAARPRPEDFRLILVEVDAGVHYLGPKLVHRIATYLEKANDPKRRVLWIERGAPPRTPSPPIIVLTRTESFGQIQQSLNFGAVAYVLKDRLYQLPFQMHLALEAASWRDDAPHFTSFRALHMLRPEVKAKLQSRKASGILHGGRSYRDEQGLHLIADEREHQWVRELPKADLHCHMGTCIHPSAINLLALNSFGHVIESGKARPPQLQRAIDRIVLCVLLAEHFHAGANGSVPPLTCLAVAAAAISPGEPGTGNKQTLNDFGVGDQIIAWLSLISDDLKTFQMTAILVAAMGWQEDEEGNPAPDIFGYLDHLERLELAHGNRPATKQVYDRKAALDIAAGEAMREVHAAAKARPRPDPFVRASEGKRWASLRKHVAKRIGLGETKIESERVRWWALLRRPPRDFLHNEPPERIQEKIRAAIKAFEIANIVRLSPQRDEVDLDKAFELPGRQTCLPPRLPIQRYVELPSPDRGEAGLKRYLQGADFLGADHLQYPENLLIAAFAITCDNALDNVIYSEIRCETPGYCKADMKAREATDILRLSFDLAALYLAHARENLPLVRINLLLAAKRHKSRREALAVANLLNSCLEDRIDERYWHIYPERWWWQPSRVIGFDLSGDEDQEPPWLEEVGKLLAQRSSPITIHAGEVTDVDRIQRAIHNDHARRIGHGLKVDENDLRAYCAREGVCMEMCPNSNVFTNEFDPFEESKTSSAYPLREYMEAGMEVCLATDNRYIHRVGTQTLTSEYMTAARLVGGLTRWEILQLVKAGFKNAFLPKQEVEALISAMEERVYRNISRGWF